MHNKIRNHQWMGLKGRLDDLFSYSSILLMFLYRLLIQQNIDHNKSFKFHAVTEASAIIA